MICVRTPYGFCRALQAESIETKNMNFRWELREKIAKNRGYPRSSSWSKPRKYWPWFFKLLHGFCRALSHESIVTKNASNGGQMREKSLSTRFPAVSGRATRLVTGQRLKAMNSSCLRSPLAGQARVGTSSTFRAHLCTKNCKFGFFNKIKLLVNFI